MVEIGQFFESALRSQREELKQAALQAVARMGGASTVSELLDSEAGEGIRLLTLRDLRDALPDLELEATPQAEEDLEVSDAERIYREILDALEAGPSTIGQLAKRVDLDATELRAYLTWMRQMEKVVAVGRGRATRYRLA